MLSLQQLRAFGLTVRYGKLTSVAQSMGISQPTVTFHLAKLEQELGMPLFISNARRAWHLTEFGQSLYQYAERMIALEDEILSLTTRTTQLQQGKIRMGSTHTPATYLFPKVFAAFKSRYPGIEISLDVAPAHVLLPKLINYNLDICFINHYPSSENDLAAQAVLEDDFVLIAHPDSPAAALHTLDPADFEDLHMIMHETSSMSRRVIDAWFQEHQIQPRILMDVSGTETMKQMVKQNLGVAIVSALSCQEEIATRTLISHKLPGFTARRTVYLTHRKDVQLTNAQEAFLHVLRQATQYAWAR